MVTLLITIAVALSAIAGVVVAVAATRPDRFEVRRAARIAAPAATIFPLIDHLRTMNIWNPFANRDPAMRGTYEGPERGPGAAFGFDGGKSGTGRIEIVESIVPARVVMRLSMVRPMAAENQIVFELAPAPGATEVTWSMSGKVPLLARVIHLLLSMDRMVGREFERGLADLKVMAERQQERLVP